MTAPLPATSQLAGALHGLKPILLGFAIRATGDRELSEDLVQETFVAALASPASFEGRSKLRTWVVGILSHKVMDHFRRQARSPVLDEEVSDDLISDPSGQDLERAAIARQSVKRLEECLTQLPERERMAVLLVDVEQLNRSEVCDALGVQATHLRVLLHRGRNRLRRMLERG
jgi:RNA polymerase sigma-70 factor (ECF subfamily)